MVTKIALLHIARLADEIAPSLEKDAAIGQLLRGAGSSLQNWIGTKAGNLWHSAPQMAGNVLQGVGNAVGKTFQQGRVGIKQIGSGIAKDNQVRFNQGLLNLGASVSKTALGGAALYGGYHMLGGSSGAEPPAPNMYYQAMPY